MTDYMFDNLGIWAVVKREKNGLEDLGFFNSYAGIENLKCIVVRLDNFEKETMKLGINRMYRLFVEDKDRFAIELGKIDRLMKRAKEVYWGIEDKQMYDLNYFKYMSPITRHRLENDKSIKPNIKNAKHLLSIKKQIDKIIENSKKPVDKFVNLEPIIIDEPRQFKDYTTQEESFIIDNFTTMPTEKIAGQLGRTKKAIINKISILRKEGRI